MIIHFSQLSKDSYTSLEVEMEQSARVTNPHSLQYQSMTIMILVLKYF